MVGEQTGRVFDPNCLTIVWARRFAAYKRPDLVTGNPTMFERMLQRTNYPVQFIWAANPTRWTTAPLKSFNRLNDMTAKYPRSAVLTGYESGPEPLPEERLRRVAEQPRSHPGRPPAPPACPPP